MNDTVREILNDKWFDTKRAVVRQDNNISNTQKRIANSTEKLDIEQHKADDIKEYVSNNIISSDMNIALKDELTYIVGQIKMHTTSIKEDNKLLKRFGKDKDKAERKFKDIANHME